MEETIKMSYVNENGKEIVKDIPESLYSTYKNIGWNEVKEKKQEEQTSKPKYLFSKKENKNEIIDEKY